MATAKKTRRLEEWADDDLVAELAKRGFPAPLLDAYVMRLRKAQDYNEGPVKLRDYFPFGLTSYAQMIHVKSMRLVSLAAQGEQPINESVRDTLVDLINYCCFAAEADRA